jgi:hypothetical protein
MVCRAAGAVKLDFAASLPGPMGPFLAPLILVPGEPFCLPPIFGSRVHIWPSSNSDSHYGHPSHYTFPLSHLNLSMLLFHLLLIRILYLLSDGDHPRV